MSILQAHAFIDWDSARRVVRRPWRAEDEPVKLRIRANYALECFSTLQERTAGAIAKLGLSAPLSISLSRIYHGWHRGVTKTDDRRALEEVRGNFRVLTTRHVSFLPDIAFGNEMSCGGSRVPLVDTLRRREDGSDEQKMVDGALVADLLCYARSESASFRRGVKPHSLAIVIADDDDLLPGPFVAEKWGLPIIVLRPDRRFESRHLNLSNLVYGL